MEMTLAEIVIKGIAAFCILTGLAGLITHAITNIWDTEDSD